MRLDILEPSVSTLPLYAESATTEPACGSTTSPAGGATRLLRRRLLLALYLPAAAALGAATLASIVTATPIADFTRDPADIVHASPFIGAISNLGILGWSATVGICLLAGLLLRAMRDTPRASRFFLGAATLTALLLLDDLFLLHERVFPLYFHIRQRYTYLLYAALVAGFLIGFRAVIRQHEQTLLILAFLFFGLSVGIDLLADHIATAVPYYHLFEDGGKFLGIVSWLGYFGSLAFERITALPPPTEPR